MKMAEVHKAVAALPVASYEACPVMDNHRRPSYNGVRRNGGSGWRRYLREEDGMRWHRWMGLGLVAGMLAGTPAAADEAPSASAVIDAAVKAHGGMANLAQTEQMTRHAAGVMSFFGQELVFKDTMVVHLPDRWRWSLIADQGGQKVQILFVVNGQRGWQLTGGIAAMEMPRERVAELREEIYVLGLATIVPLKQDSGFEFEVLPEEKVGDQPAVGLKVRHKGRPDVRLYFDKTSGLLVKIQRQARDAGITVNKEYLYAAHKSFDGVQLPTKYTELTNGKKFVDVGEIRYEFHRRLDERLFEKP